MPAEATLNLETIAVHIGPLKAPLAALVAASLARGRVVTVADRLDARAWVVEDPSAPGQRILWLATLHGGYVLSPEYVNSGTGMFLAFKKATITRRWLWVSPEFAIAHPILAAIVGGAVGTGASRWSKISSRDAYLAKIKSSRAKRARNFYVIALVSEKEKRLDKD